MPPRAWNTPDLNRVEANLPPMRKARFNPPPEWNIREIGLQPSLSRRSTPNPALQPDQRNHFSTEKLVEALAVPPTASRNSPASLPIPIPQRKGAHTAYSPPRRSQHSASSRHEDAARAAMRQALTVPQRRTPPLPETPRASARQPAFAAARKLVDRPRVHLEQRPVPPQGGAVQRGRQEGGMQPGAHLQSQGTYRNAQPMGYTPYV
ncbi:hypothetical protein C8R47DRAFT_1067154 [Mycena vitilis]|nr:hypothetical protein C8R47DRAFT_1067154 [Mycena vitilis]